jgi:hypothetical protein
VAASTDLTGAASKGGNWTLESTNAQIDTAALQVLGYEGVLPNTTPTITNLDSDSVISSTLTPLATDVFSFNQSGFTVSGGDLQTGGSTTFGTFTNTSGLLSVSFNASATNALVQDLMRGVLYRNDTPTDETTASITTG